MGATAAAHSSAAEMRTATAAMPASTAMPAATPSAVSRVACARKRDRQNNDG
jgi:hypothetical protein